MRIYTLLVLLVSLSCCSRKEIKPESRPIPIQHNPHLTEFIAELESEFKAVIEKKRTPGMAVAVVWKDSTLLCQGFGVKKYGEADSIDQKTLFRLGSVSKTLASGLAATQVTANTIHWDDTIRNYLPDFKLSRQESSDQLTIHHVLSHTSGLPMHAYTNLVEAGLSLTEIIRRLRDVRLNAAVGQLYSYQNVAYSLIDRVLEQATGTSYNRLMKEKIFDPLGMDRASLTYETITSDSNVAMPHLYRRGTWKPIPINTHYYNSVPAGGVNASIADMAQWLKLMLGNYPQVLSKERIEEITTPQIITPIIRRYYRSWKHVKSAHYGYGWRILTYRDHTIYYHGGYVNGYRSEVVILPGEELGFCFLSNSLNRYANNAVPTFIEHYLKYAEKVKKWELARQGKVDFYPFPQPEVSLPTDSTGYRDIYILQ